ncbi:hypothetical protein Tco_1216967 [Tanacetum coccineum]
MPAPSPSSSSPHSPLPLHRVYHHHTTEPSTPKPPPQPRHPQGCVRPLSRTKMGAIVFLKNTAKVRLTLFPPNGRLQYGFVTEKVHSGWVVSTPKRVRLLGPTGRLVSVVKPPSKDAFGSGNNTPKGAFRSAYKHQQEQVGVQKWNKGAFGVAEKVIRERLADVDSQGLWIKAIKSFVIISSNETKKNSDAPLIEEWISNNEDEVESPVVVEKKTVVLAIPKFDVVRPKQQEKPVRKIVRYDYVDVRGRSRSVMAWVPKKSMTEDINVDWETRYAKEGNEINIIDGVMICFKEKI